MGLKEFTEEVKEFTKKHLGKTAVAAGVAAAVALPSSCNKGNPTQNERNTDKQGLLDDKPLPATDEYDNTVVLTQANVPEYDENGDLTGLSVLTRGIDKTEYESPQAFEDMDVKPTYLNGSPTPVDVMVDRNGAILTDRGFCGLFRDFNGHVHIVAGDEKSESVKRFVEGQNKAREDAVKRATAEKQAYAASRKARAVRASEPADSTAAQPVVTDTSRVDSSAVRTDTLAGKFHSAGKSDENVILDTLLKQRGQGHDY